MSTFYNYSPQQLDRMRISQLPDGVYTGSVYEVEVIDSFKTFRLELIIRMSYGKRMFTYTCPLAWCAEKPMSDFLTRYGRNSNYDISCTSVKFLVKNVTEADGTQHTEITEFLFPEVKSGDKKDIKSISDLLDDSDDYDLDDLD